MRTVDHKALAGILIKRYMHNLPYKYCLAFYIGCIEPDYNPFSYFHGFFSSYSLYGHNFCNVRKFLDRLFRKLNKSKKQSRIFYFNLGLLIHYVTDAFTHAHTGRFSGTLYQHSQYEQQLHIAFKKFVLNNDSGLYTNLITCSSIGDISRIHEIYSKENVSVYNDLIFIFSIVNSIMNNFYLYFNNTDKFRILE